MPQKAVVPSSLPLGRQERMKIRRRPSVTIGGVCLLGFGNLRGSELRAPVLVELDAPFRKQKPRNASLELDSELAWLSGRKDGTTPGHDWSSLPEEGGLSAQYFRRRPSAICCPNWPGLIPRAELGDTFPKAAR